MGYKKDAWLEMFKHAVAEPFGFMYLNSKRPKPLRIMKNFDIVLSHHQDGEEFDDEEIENPKKKRRIK